MEKISKDLKIWRDKQVGLVEKETFITNNMHAENITNTHKESQMI